jgi:hypothetical protein
MAYSGASSSASNSTTWKLLVLMSLILDRVSHNATLYWQQFAATNAYRGQAGTRPDATWTDYGKGSLLFKNKEAVDLDSLYYSKTIARLTKKLWHLKASCNQAGIVERKSWGCCIHDGSRYVK